MTRAFLVVVGFCLLLVSCTQRMICPAYQSAYIYDKDAMRKKFSYFIGDSTPKVYSASKTKYLIAEPTTYKKKLRSLQTVPMTKVNTVVPDSLSGNGEITKAELDMAAQSIIDSTYIVDVQPADSLQTAEDSVYMISKDRELRILKYDPMKRKYFVDTVGYNTEQNNYMWYLRDVLVLPDARLAQQQNEEAKKEGSGKATAKKEKKGIKGFFAGLFKKKDKSTLVQDSTLTTTPVEEEDYGYDDFDGKVKDSTNVQTQAPQPAPKQKKGMFSFLKKEKKPEKKKADTPPAKKEENDNDGF